MTGPACLDGEGRLEDVAAGAGEDLNRASETYGHGPLHLAAREGREEILKMLLQRYSSSCVKVFCIGL